MRRTPNSRNCGQFVGQQFDRLGVFTYSDEPDTPSAVARSCYGRGERRRRERLMAIQQPIAFERTQAQVGRQVDVLLDQPVAGQRNVWIGRSRADAPDVDGVIYVTGGRSSRSPRVRSCPVKSSLAKAMTWRLSPSGNRISVMTATAQEQPRRWSSMCRIN